MWLGRPGYSVGSGYPGRDILSTLYTRFLSSVEVVVQFEVAAAVVRGLLVEEGLE